MAKLIKMVMRSINRNIVECKDRKLETLAQGSTVLIETLWNVKQRSTRGATDGGAGINRNIVECKDRKRRNKNHAYKY